MPDLPIALRRYLDVSRQPADSTFHTSQVSISFGETIDASALKAAWEIVAGSHAALRTTFAADGSTTVADSATFDWRELDWQTSSPAAPGAEWQSIVSADTAAPIATPAAPPCRFTLIRLPDGNGHALWSFHGALLDDASVSTVLHQWLHAYDALRTGADVPQFDATTVTDPVEGADWKAEFEDFKPTRPLIVLPLPDSESNAGTRRSISHTFERPERTEFATAATSMKTDLRGLFGAAWAFVISRATTSDDALLLETSRPTSAIGRGETFHVRRHRVEKSRTATDLARSFAQPSITSPADIQALAQALSLAPADLEPATTFLYRGLTLNDRLQLEMPRWMAADTQLFQKTAAPITLRVVAADRPELALDYDPTVLSDSAAQLLFDLFLGTLQAFATDPALALADFVLPGKPAIIEGDEAPATFRSLVPQSLHELFADVAGESPDIVAVEMGDEKLTFSQLNSAANQLARHLRKSGIEPGARVGVAMPRSPRWITALLGTLKAGASIVPLANGAAKATAGVKAWIVDVLPEGETRGQPVIQMLPDAGAISGEKSRGLQNESAPTSEALAWDEAGTTLFFSHETVATAFQSTAALLGLTPADRVLQFAPTSTFSALEETLATLLSGATLVLREDPGWATRTAVQEFVRDSAITTVSLPTPFWSQWTHYLAELSLQTPATLRQVAISGPLPSPNATAAWHAAAGATRLLYRTPVTQACGLGLAGDPIANDPSVLGGPGPATTARLVDKRGLAQPAGLAGHVEVAPRGGKFVPLQIEAFVSPENGFHHRATLQAQIVGTSPEVLVESIRLVATTHPGVLDAHVEQRLIAARKEWCVWIVARDSQRGEPHDFRDWLTAHLPSAPRRIRAVSRLPLDEAGHIDAAALAEMLPEDGSALPTQKGTDDEERMRKAISRALGGRRIELDESISDGRTKPQTARLLHEAVVREESRVELSDSTTAFSVRSLLRNVRGRKTGTDSKWTPLQPLRASGKQPPLIFIHDLDGASKLYASLVARLGAEQPCYAITARGLADPNACHTSIPEMASAYIEALRVFETNAPYRLAGYGFGGLVAFEMARQLTAENAEAPLLILLATEPPGGISPIGFLAGGWKHSLSALFGGKPARETNGRRRPQETPVSLANKEAAQKFTASRSSLLAHIFTPTEDFPPCRAVQSGWEAVCGEVLLYQVPCTGPDMMQEPAVEAIAGAILDLGRPATYEPPAEK
jgi:non-ribosomal peptide synthetase component F/thioesterase domain-containing protein